MGVKMKKYYDLALIMKKKVYANGNVEFIPFKLVEGTFDKEEETFVDMDGTAYYHIIENPPSIGFACRDNIEMYRKNYPYLPLPLLKSKIFNTVKDYSYMYCFKKSGNIMVPGIIRVDTNKKEDNTRFFLDTDLVGFYSETFPGFLNEVLGVPRDDTAVDNEKVSDMSLGDSTMDVSKMYDELTSKVIDQDEPISKILTAIWKQYNNFSDNKSRNMLINGSTGVGKTEIFRILTKMLNIPYYMTAATDYSATGYIGKSVEDMLQGLLRNANYDIESAQRGILVIDEIDKLAESNKNSSQINQKDVQEALLKLLEDGVFSLNVNGKVCEFDTSKLLVIGMGSWSRIELEEKRPVGFDAKPIKKEYKDITRDDMVSSGMIPELIGRFPVVVQMNELGYESFVRILNSENNMLNLNKRFFSDKGISLVVSDEAIEAIARKAHKQKYGARSLDEIIETMLSAASFEIAKNPGLYSELIVTPETIQDNKKYMLVRRKEEQK